MPRGKYVNHKGRGRSFTSPEELAREQKDIQEKKLRKKKLREERLERGEEEGSSSEEEEEKPAVPKESGDDEEASEDESSSEDDDGNKKSKGVEGLIEIENPNRRVLKQKKLSRLEDTSGQGAGGAASSGGATAAEKPELSRREREAIEKQRAKAHYQKLHAEGKTEEARKDLARLAIIRKQREEAAAKRLTDQQDKDALKQTKQSELSKALGKK